MKGRKLPAILVGILLLTAVLLAQTPVDWPMVHGDYSGRHFSALKKINASNVNNLAQAWTWRANPGSGPAAGGGATSATIKGTPIEVNGVLYTTIPDHVWKRRKHKRPWSSIAISMSQSGCYV